MVLVEHIHPRLQVVEVDLVVLMVELHRHHPVDLKTEELVDYMVAEVAVVELVSMVRELVELVVKVL